MPQRRSPLFLNLTLVLALAAFAAPQALPAEPGGHDHHSMDHGDMKDTMPAAWADGEVRKIERDSGKITLRHGEVANLKMRAMTMPWKVKDMAMLDGLKVGDKVRFTADKIDGQFTITAMEQVQ